MKLKHYKVFCKSAGTTIAGFGVTNQSLTSSDFTRRILGDAARTCHNMGREWDPFNVTLRVEAQPESTP